MSQSSTATLISTESTRSVNAQVWQLSNLLRGLVTVPSAQDRQIVAMTLDSRDVVANSLFCALKGTRQHGLEFAQHAVAQGAVAILAEPATPWTRQRCDDLASTLGIPILPLPGLWQCLSSIAGKFYGNPGAALDLIGVTGTNGKTSVCHILAQVIYPYRSCGIVGTLGYGISDELTDSNRTTPDAIRLQAILAQLRDQGLKTVAMEVSSHALHQGRTACIPITTAVFTNLTRDHLDYHQHLGAYAQAKRRLFQMDGLKHAILNADDPLSLEILADLNPLVEPVLYSLEPGFVPPRSHPTARWLRLEFLEHHDRSMRLWITGSWGRGDVTVPMLGRFNAANLLAVLAVLLVRNQDLDATLKMLANARGVPGRMECFSCPAQPLVIVDYAHTPDALEQVLRELRAHQPHRLITVFGCGGERDKGKRPQMGAVAERMSDLVIVTDDNPRSEDGEHIVREILAGMEYPKKVQIERHRDLAIRQAIQNADAKDIVLIAGKGHETTQRIGDTEYPFSDRIEVERILRECSANEQKLQPPSEIP